MKSCYNCENPVRDNDKFCRSCGCPIASSKHYLFLNVFIVFAALALLGLLILFGTSFIIMK